jgi:hypothetical protein
MVAQVPVRKIEQLVERLIAHHDAIQINEFELQRLKREIKLELASFPGDAHMALGMLACLKGDLSEARSQHETSLAQGWTTERGLNYAVTLQQMYCYDEGLQMTKKVMESDPLHLGAIQMAIRDAFMMGRFRLAAKLCEEYRKRAPDDQWPGDLAGMKAGINKVLLVVEELDLEDELVASMHEPAWELIRSNFKRGVTPSIYDHLGNDGSPFIYRTLRFPISFEAAQRLDDQLVERVAEFEDWPLEKFAIIIREQEST